MPPKKAEQLSKDNALKERSFEERLARLQAITSQLEQGELSLESSLALYGEGVELAKSCRTLLEQAKHTVELYTAEGLTEFKPLDAKE